MISRKCRVLLCLVILCLLPLLSLGEASVVSAPLSRSSSARNGMVRVFLSSLGNPSSLNITVQGSYTIGGDTSAPLKNGDKVKVGFSSSTGKLTLTRNGVTRDMGSAFTLTRHSTSSSSGLLIAETKNPSNPYPGDLKFKVEKNGSSYKLYTIASIYIETYLYGVLPYEMGNSAHIEALKAQAVAARTYTLDKMNLRASNLYDVVDTTNDQVYRGTPSGDANCKTAVDATKGIVAMNGSSLTSTYYTASNGGQTESAANAWGSSGQYAYLKVKDDPFDLNASGSQKRSITIYGEFNASAQNSSLKSLLLSKAKSRLSSMGYQSSTAAIRSITSVVPHTPKFASPSRLYTKVDFKLTTQVKNSGGVWQNVSLSVTCDIFSELESALGLSINSGKNELWSVSKSGSNFVLTARRYGHGVGLSQQGAMQMGLLGYTYDQILGFYYTGCKRMQYAFTHTIMSPVSEGGSTIITTTENPAELEDDDTATAIVSLVSQDDLLGIRSSANAAAKVIGAVPNGAPVKVYAVSDGWCFIGYGDIKGYAQLSGLNFSGEAPSATDQKPTAVTQFAIVETDSGSLNLREKASSSSNRVGGAPKGAVLSVFSVSNGWAHVQYGALTAYASTEYLRFCNTYPAQVTNPGQTTAKVTLSDTTDTVNFRSTPSTDGAILKRLPHGTQVVLIRSDGAWCQVNYGGSVGYIMADFLTVVGQSDTETDDDQSKTPEVNEPGSVFAVVNTQSGSLNMRSKAQSGSMILTTIPKGARVKVLERGEWSRVSYEGYIGYVLSSFLSYETDPNESEKIPEKDHLTAIVTTESGSLNLREQPKSWAAVLARIPQNTTISILDRDDYWSKTVYQGQTGYVMNSFLTFNDFPTEEETAPEPDKDQESVKTITAQVITQSGSLNLRSQPKSSASIKRTIPRLAWVEVVETGDSWCHVIYQGTDGYVMRKYLENKTEDSSTPDEESNPPVNTTEPPALEADAPAWVNTGNGDDLNFRTEPNGSVIMTLPVATKVTVIAQQGEWSQIIYEDSVGYVMSKYLSSKLLQKPENSVTQKPADEPTATPKPTQKPTQKPQASLDPTLEKLENSIPAQVIAHDGLNLREYCSKDAKILLEIPGDAFVRVIQEGQEWCQVVYEEETGYCMTRYLKLILW